MLLLQWFFYSLLLSTVRVAAMVSLPRLLLVYHYGNYDRHHHHDYYQHYDYSCCCCCYYDYCWAATTTMTTTTSRRPPLPALRLSKIIVRTFGWQWWRVWGVVPCKQTSIGRYFKCRGGWSFNDRNERLRWEWQHAPKNSVVTFKDITT